MTPPPPEPPPPGPGATGRLEAGQVVADRYEVVRRLGSGGMSTVYLARHRAMDRLCALKVLHPRLAVDPEARERFSREARNASRISHPAVATVFDFGATPEGLVYLVMEYVEGRTLGGVLAERQTLPPAQVARLAERIGAGLDAAHALGIVHRDLKPDNVMLGGAAGAETVKLVDFGIAKALETASAQELTSDGVVVGTPEYMAPEQFAGDRVDHRSDIYALALVCYRMLTGRIPHRAGSARETLTRRLTEPAEPLGRSPSGVEFPAEVDDLFSAALARDPAERPATAGEFGAALGGALAAVNDPSAEGAMTVKLDGPTVATPRAATAPAFRRGWLWPAAGVAGVALLVLLLQPETPVPTAGTGTDSAPSATGLDTVAGATAPTPGAPPPPAPPPPGAPAATPGLLTLPTPEEVTDPKLADASRRRAEQIYLRADDAPDRRAQAAFIVATIHFAAGRLSDAEQWTTRAIDVNDSTPAGAARDGRGSRYGDFLALLRRQLQPPDLP